jgi:uncharacterized protein (DUF362 family)
MTCDRTRRRILRTLLGIPGLGALATLGDRLSASGVRPADASGETAIPGPPPSKPSAPSRPRVARCRRDDLIDEAGRIVRGRLDDILKTGLTRAVGEETPVAAMRRLFRPADVVGLKLNCLAGRGPDPAIVRRLCAWLQEAGVPARNIVLWDRTDRELKGAGFPIVRSGSGVRCIGTNDDYDWTPKEWGPGGSCFARLLAKDLTAHINVGLLKDHDLAGVSIGMKNWYGAIHNPNKHHEDGCAPFIPHLAAYPLIRDRLRLTVIDATTAQCHGGPALNPRWRWNYGGVLMSTDPVAIDAVGRRLIEERREEVNLPSLAEEKREPVWIAAAARLGLGEADLRKIEIVDA